MALNIEYNNKDHQQVIVDNRCKKCPRQYLNVARNNQTCHTSLFSSHQQPKLNTTDADVQNISSRPLHSTRINSTSLKSDPIMNFVSDIDNLDDYCFNLITDEIAEKAANDFERIFQKGSCENDKVNYFR